MKISSKVKKIIVIFWGIIFFISLTFFVYSQLKLAIVDIFLKKKFEKVEYSGYKWHPFKYIYFDKLLMLKNGTEIKFYNLRVRYSLKKIIFKKIDNFEVRKIEISVKKSKGKGRKFKYTSFLKMSFKIPRIIVKKIDIDTFSFAFGKDKLILTNLESFSQFREKKNLYRIRCLVYKNEVNLGKIEAVFSQSKDFLFVDKIYFEGLGNFYLKRKKDENVARFDIKTFSIKEIGFNDLEFCYDFLKKRISIYVPVIYLKGNKLKSVKLNLKLVNDKFLLERVSFEYNKGLFEGFGEIFSDGFYKLDFKFSGVDLRGFTLWGGGELWGGKRIVSSYIKIYKLRYKNILLKNEILVSFDFDFKSKYLSGEIKSKKLRIGQISQFISGFADFKGLFSYNFKDRKFDLKKFYLKIYDFQHKFFTFSKFEVYKVGFNFYAKFWDLKYKEIGIFSKFNLNVYFDEDYHYFKYLVNFETFNRENYSFKGDGENTKDFVRFVSYDFEGGDFMFPFVFNFYKKNRKFVIDVKSSRYKGNRFSFVFRGNGEKIKGNGWFDLKAGVINRNLKGRIKFEYSFRKDSIFVFNSYFYSDSLIFKRLFFTYASGELEYRDSLFLRNVHLEGKGLVFNGNFVWLNGFKRGKMSFIFSDVNLFNRYAKGVGLGERIYVNGVLDFSKLGDSLHINGLGGGHIENFVVRSTNTMLKRFDFKFEVKDNKIYFKNIVGKSNYGWVKGNGRVDVKGGDFKIDFHLNLHKFDVSSSQAVALISGPIEITKDFGDKRVWLGGEFDIDEALVFDISYSSKMKKKSKKSVRYIFYLRGDKKIYIDTDVISAELEVSLNVNKVDDYTTYYNGFATIKRGTIWYFNIPFEITEGDITFDNVEYLIPDIHIVAKTDIDTYQVQLNFVYEKGKMDFYFTSNPPLSQDEIIVLLFGEFLPVTGGAEEAVFSLMSGYLFHTFKRQMDIDELTIYKSKGIGITVGKYIGTKFFIRYSQDLSDLMRNRIYVRYYLNKLISLYGSYGVSGEKMSGVEIHFSF